MSGGHFPLTTAVLEQHARQDAAEGRTLEEGVAHLAHDSKLRAIYEAAYNAALAAEVA